MAATTIARKDWVDEKGVVHKNDIYLEHGQFGMASGKDSHAQTIEAVIKTMYGEVSTDRSLGIPYMTTVFQNTRTKSMWAAAVMAAVKELDFVKTIEKFEYDYDPAREAFTYELTVTTDIGKVSISG